MVKPRVTDNTKIADAIAAEPALLERLVALHPTFKRLRNPLVRRPMGRLVTLGDAVRITGVALGELLAVAGAPAPEGGERTPPGLDDETARPGWLDALDLEGAERLAEDHWRVVFRRDREAAPPAAAPGKIELEATAVIPQ